VIMNPPGTIHALGEGTLLYELQQSSDLTYRLYDWDRNDPSRQLHIAKSLDVADLLPLSLHKTEPVTVEEPGASRTYLCACKDFAAERVAVRASIVERPAGACFHVLTVLQGAGSVRYGTLSRPRVPLRAGESVLVPARLNEYVRPAEGPPLVVIKAYVPDLVQDIVMPLRRRGVAEETIVQLGGDPRHSDLAPYLCSEA
jgi:mannose-6-phosphate isomerase